MAGHSQFANIKHRKGAQDTKRAKLFTKLLREITVAAKTGQPDPEFNPRLRNGIIAARSANVPKDRVDGAIKKVVAGNEGENFEEIRYEGYGSSGVAFIIETMTDNKNRTAGEIRSILTKAGGSLGETNSVAFMFDRIGLIEYQDVNIGEEVMLEAALDAGAEDVRSDKNHHFVICKPDEFGNVYDKLSAKFGEPKTAKLDWEAKNFIDLDLELEQKITKLVDLLEDCDDVQSVNGNFIIR